MNDTREQSIKRPGWRLFEAEAGGERQHFQIGRFEGFLFRRKIRIVPGSYHFITCALLLIRLHIDIFGLDGENRSIENVVMSKSSSFSLDVILLYILLH